MEAKIVEHLVNTSSCCNFSHPLTKRTLPFGSPLHVQVRIKQDKVEISLQQVETLFSQLRNFLSVLAHAIAILQKIEFMVEFVR